MSKLDTLTDDQFRPLLAESEHAFLPNKDTPHATAATLIEKFQRDEKYEVLGYKIGETAVSYIVARSGRTDDEIALGPMYVGEEHRGYGYGKRQIEDFVRRFGDEGYTSVLTRTWLGNVASRHSFESLGFVEIDRIEGDRANGDTTVVYSLQIAEPEDINLHLRSID